MNRRICIFLALLSLQATLCLQLKADELELPSTRPFFMGFTRWPADLTPEGFLTAQNFAHTHGDIVSVMFIGGIPWPESLADEAFSSDVQNNLAYRPPQGTKLFLSISPLNQDRKGLAPYWGEKDNQPLPGQWTDYALNSPQVKTAFLNFVLRAVKAMNPDYLAIGIENNVLLSHSILKWRQLVELHQETYEAVKRIHPQLPVCFTTEVLHYRKLASDARGSDQETQVAELMKYSDLFAIVHDLEGRPDRHLRLAVPHVAAHQSIHGSGMLQILFNIQGRTELVRGLLVGKGGLHLGL